jgi:hypothetical protein
MRVLQERIDLKLVYQDARRTIPAENFKGLEKRVAEHFEKKVLAKRISAAGLGSRRELDEKLRSLGTSLEQQKRAFVEQAVCDIWKREKDVADPQAAHGEMPEISHEEMLDYFHEHEADFQKPARALWEKLTVRVPRYSDGAEAYAVLARMGNQVMQGMPMEKALQTRRAGDLEYRGGTQGWVTQGSLEVSRAMEEVVFGLPVGQLSRIFRDDGAFHIVRVLQREEFKPACFEDAQVEIREKLHELRFQEKKEAYLARLRKEIPVWTVFDDDPELAQLQRTAGPLRK